MIQDTPCPECHALLGTRTAARHALETRLKLAKDTMGRILWLHSETFTPQETANVMSYPWMPLAFRRLHEQFAATGMDPQKFVQNFKKEFETMESWFSQRQRQLQSGEGFP